LSYESIAQQQKNLILKHRNVVISACHLWLSLYGNVTRAFHLVSERPSCVPVDLMVFSGQGEVLQLVKVSVEFAVHENLRDGSSDEISIRGKKFQACLLYDFHTITLNLANVNASTRI